MFGGWGELKLDQIPGLLLQQCQYFGCHLFFGVHVVGKRSGRAFFYLIDNFLGRGIFGRNPRSLSRIEYFSQAFEADCRVDAFVWFPNNGYFSVGVFLCDLFHGKLIVNR